MDNSGRCGANRMLVALLWRRGKAANCQQTSVTQTTLDLWESVRSHRGLVTKEELYGGPEGQKTTTFYYTVLLHLHII